MQRAEPTGFDSFGLTTLQDSCAQSQSFNGLLADCAVRGISNLVGSSAANSLLFHSSLLDHIGDPRMIHQGLYSLLGDEAEIVEKSVVKRLFRKLGLPFRDCGFNFERSIDLAVTINRTRAREVHTA
jgi:hypothetical protein